MIERRKMRQIFLSWWAFEVVEVSLKYWAKINIAVLGAPALKSVYCKLQIKSPFQISFANFTLFYIVPYPDGNENKIRQILLMSPEV